MKFEVINRASSGEVVAAVAGKRIRVLSYLFSAAALVTVRWDSATTPLSGAMSAAAGTPFSAPQGPISAGGTMGIMQTERGEALNLTLGGAVQVSGHLVYEEVM